MSDDDQHVRLTDDEAETLFDGLFPQGFAGADVLADLAPEGWERSPLLACFHPSPEQVFQEALQMHRNIERLLRARRIREPDNPKLASRPEPTPEAVRADWQDTPIKLTEEVTQLVGLCLWDVFSDNHEVIAVDGRVVDIGSFRGAAGFIAGYISGPGDPLWSMDYMQFYMGTIGVGQRADLTPVYRMIFHRLKVQGADWVFHFPELGLVDMSPLREALPSPKPEDYSPSEAFAQEQAEQERQAGLERVRAELAEGNAQSRAEAMDRPPPAIVRAYEDVYGCEPKGWPPA